MSHGNKIIPLPPTLGEIHCSRIIEQKESQVVKSNWRMLSETPIP